MTKIIACIDGSKAALDVCDAAAWSQRQLEAPLELLHVLERPAEALSEDMTGAIGLGAREHLLEELAEIDHRRSRLMLEQGRLMLDEAARRVAAAGVPETALSQRQRHDSLVDALVESESDTRLLIMGRLGEAHANARDAIGSHLETATRTLHRPILITVGAFEAPQDFVLAYDGSATADKALTMVAGSPLLRGARCHLVHVGDCSATQRAELDRAQEALVAAGFEVLPVDLPSGDVADSLVTYCAQAPAQLVVMGAWGHTRIRQFLVGSVTSAMLHKSVVPLLLLR